MISTDPPEKIVRLVRELCRLHSEAEWVEFKRNMVKPAEIGQYISALSNSAALNNKPHAYLLWGVQDDTHEIVGTDFDPHTFKKGNEPLENWLLRLLEPRIDFQFCIVDVDDRQVVLIKISCAISRPVSFSGTEYVRIGEVMKPLKDAPERERKLWKIFEQTPFETITACEGLDADDVLRLLDYPAYFDLLNQTLPANRNSIIDALRKDELIRKNCANSWDILNLGAILLAKDLNNFHNLRRKAIRIIQYPDSIRVETKTREQMGKKGYAAGFSGLIEYINNLLPNNEVLGQALRETIPMFPSLAIRELVANALIHQDFFTSGEGPMVEIFADRMEITNPGEPLVSVDRFVDAPPKSRNETLASLMRRFGICEERGSGIDKVVHYVEMFQLPAPLFEAPGGSTRTVLFAHKELNAMDKQERIRAVYLHACLRYVERGKTTNASLRKRFGISDQNAAVASRLFKEAIEDHVIIPEDLSVGKRSRSYLPVWAISD